MDGAKGLTMSVNGAVFYACLTEDCIGEHWGIALRSTESDCIGVAHQGSAMRIHAVSEYIFPTSALVATRAVK